MAVERTIRNGFAVAAKAAAENGYYAFNDLHARMAYLGAGDTDNADELLAALESASNSAAATDGDNRFMSNNVGLPVALALMAFKEARCDEAIELLRDVLNLTLVAAAQRAGRPALALHVLHERLAAKRHSPLAAGWRDRLQAG